MAFLLFYKIRVILYNKNMQKGFGLIGVLIALVIIMTLAAVLLPKYTKTVQTQHHEQQQLLQQAQQVQQQLNARQQAHERQLSNL